MKFAKAINHDSYTYTLEGIYPSKISAQSQFNELKRKGELCEDSKYRIIQRDNEYMLYIWW